jgi:hypothetical protein
MTAIKYIATPVYGWLSLIKLVQQDDVARSTQIQLDSAANCIEFEQYSIMWKSVCAMALVCDNLQKII